MPTGTSQTWDPFQRRFRLLLVLTDKSDDGAWQASDDLVLSVEGYHGLTTEQAEGRWAEDSRWRYTLRKKLRDDVEELRALGFHVQHDVRRPRVRPLSHDPKKDNGVSWYRLKPSPLVPVPLAAADVRRLVQLVAAQRAEGVELPEAAVSFSRARDAGQQVRCTDGEHVVKGDPVQLVLRGTGAWLGVVRSARDERMLTLRLGERYDVEVLDLPAAPLALASPQRALDPLTWGSGPGETLRVRVQERALGRALDVLGPAVQVQRQVAEQQVELDLRVTDRRLLLARLVALRTTVDLVDPQWRAALRRHLQPLAAPATWAPAGAPLGFGTVSSDDDAAEASPRPVTTAGLELLEGPGGKGRGLVGMTLLALALLDAHGRLDARDLAARLKTSVGTLDTALTRYNAAEADVLGDHPSLSWQIAPLVLHRDGAGVLQEVEQPSSLRPRTEALGRFLVGPQVVLAACAVAARQLAQGRSDPSVDLAAFVRHAQVALGVTFQTEGLPAQGPEAVDVLAPDMVRQVEKALKAARRGDYRGRSAAAPAAAGLPVGGRPLHRLDYEDPWTAELTSRDYVLLGLRRQGPLHLLDVLDVGARTADGTADSGPTPLAPTVRTLVVRHLHACELIRGRRYPLGDHEREQYARTTGEAVVVRVAVRPGSGPGPSATLRRGWHGNPVQHAVDGRELVAVRLHPPAAERVLDLLATWPDDLVLVDEPVLAAAVQQRVQELLQHHV